MAKKVNAFCRIVMVLGVLSILFTLNASQSVSADPLTPTVNGLFYGDGDYQLYTWLDESYFGSDLYGFYDAASQKLYVALVVDRSINDNVFGASESGAGNYMSSAGWGAGGGQQRAAKVLQDSEFASFNFACAPNSPQDWAWMQGYACDSTPSDGVNGPWVSDSTCGTSGSLPNGSNVNNGYPPGLESASSFAWNINKYEENLANGTNQWDMFVYGSTYFDWKSPFDSNDPNNVVGLEGYPAATSVDDLSAGPAITYSETYEWEWSMVYEWSIDLGPGGANCGSNGLYLVTGMSHHSPLKEGEGSASAYYGEDQLIEWCEEENDCFPDDDGGDGPAPFSDWGDLPDTYGTTVANNGPSHQLTVASPYLGSVVAFEADGQPSANADGDGTEEDGVLRDLTDTWEANATVNLNVTVGGNSGVLVGWFDFDNNGSFESMVNFGTLSPGASTVQVTLPPSYASGTSIAARFRIFDPTAIPGGSVDFNDFTGEAIGGEVEDYVWPFAPNAVTLIRTESQTLLPFVYIAFLGIVILVGVPVIRRKTTAH